MGYLQVIARGAKPRLLPSPRQHNPSAFRAGLLHSHFYL